MRTPYDWNDSLLALNESIDSDHRCIFEMGREIEAAVHGLDAGRQLYLVHQLLNYVGTHFKMEESLMREHQYKRLREHAERHRQLEEGLQVLLSNIMKLSGRVPPDEWRKFTESFVRSLVLHIKSEDKLLAQFLRQVNLEAVRSRITDPEDNRGAQEA
jgi:hemerythrin-like metal-binding protein